MTNLFVASLGFARLGSNRFFRQANKCFVGIQTAGDEPSAPPLFVLRSCRDCLTFGIMKTLTVRLPEALVAEIERESQVRRVSKSDVVRERLGRARNGARASQNMRDLVGDLIGSVGRLPADLSSKKKKYLPELIRAEKHHRR